MNRFQSVLTTALVVVLTACQGGNQSVSLEEHEIELKYATMLAMREGNGYIAAEFKNPWDSTKVLHRYVLVPKDQELPSNLPEGDIIRTPLSHLLCYVSVHASLFNELNVLDAISGLGDAKYIYVDKLQEGLKNGKIKDVGVSKTFDIEKIIDLNPDAVILSAMEDQSSYSKLFSLGIPVVECADYMETGPLERAEWMKFYGILVGKRAEADSIFAKIDKEYTDLKELVKDKENKPTVLDGKKLNSTWYVAGIESTVGRIITDAGGNYVFSDETSNGSVPYSPEAVLARGADADIWMLKYYNENTLTYKDVADDWKGYTQLKAFKNKQVYGVNLDEVPFYMDTPFHPEVLLKEYIRIFHPDVLPDQSLYYYKPLAD